MQAVPSPCTAAVRSIWPASKSCSQYRSPAWQRAILATKPPPPKTRQSTNFFGPELFVRSSSTESLSVRKALTGWIFEREIQHGAQAFGQLNLQIGSCRLA